MSYILQIEANRQFGKYKKESCQRIMKNDSREQSITKEMNKKKIARTIT